MINLRFILKDYIPPLKATITDFQGNPISDYEAYMAIVRDGRAFKELTIGSGIEKNNSEIKIELPTDIMVASYKYYLQITAASHQFTRISGNYIIVNPWEDGMTSVENVIITIPVIPVNGELHLVDDQGNSIEDSNNETITT